MNKQQNILILIGSPKGKSSTSNSLGDYFSSKLQEFGLSVEKNYIYKIVKKPEREKELLSKVNNTDLIILAFPLYVDCLPAGVIEVLELIANHRKSLGTEKKIGLVVLINCGFPESEQNNTAIKICTIFAHEVGFEWKGALSLGMGGAVGGRALEERGGMVRNLKKGYDLAAQALAEGNIIPEEAIELTAKRFIPKKLYTMMGNFMWNRQAKKFGIRKKEIKNKPYA